MNWNPRQGLGLQTISMVAAALADDYKVNILMSGNVAATARNKDTGETTIVLPVLELDDPDYLTLLRGYIDHEAGHVRFTDFGAVERVLQQHMGDYYKISVTNADRISLLANIYEDIFVERKMGEYYLGCKKNFRNISEALFCGDKSPANTVLKKVGNNNQLGMELVAQYILYNVRSQVHNALCGGRDSLRLAMEDIFPGLADKLDILLSDISSKTSSTQANAELAVETKKIIDEYIQESKHQLRNERKDSGEQGNENEQSAGGEGGGKEGGGYYDGSKPLPTERDIDVLASNSTDDLVKATTSVSAHITEGIQKLRKDAGVKCRNATTMTMKDADGTVRSNRYELGGSSGNPNFCLKTDRLSISQINESLRASGALDTQLRSLLQTFVLNKGGVARTGKLDTRKLSRLAVNNPRVFRTNVEKQGISTDVIILMDASGSMNGSCINLASMALYAIMKSLRKIQGVRSSAYAFGGDEVLEVVAADKKLTDKVLVNPNGGTACGEALMAVVPKFAVDTYDRRIIMILTDGASQNADYFTSVLRKLDAAGVTVLGIGMLSDAIAKHIADPNRVSVISNMKELVPELFRMLRKNLVGVGL